MHEIIVREDGTIDTADAAILCGIKPVSIRQRIRRGLIREVRRDRGRILVYLLDVARVDGLLNKGMPRVPPEISWRLEGEPDVDILAVFRACSRIAQDAASPQARKPIVYYIRFGDRIKIGTTVSPVSRLADLPHDEVLATEPGGKEVEDERHARFAEYRLTGEWFCAAPDILRHVAELRSRSFASVTPDV